MGKKVSAHVIISGRVQGVFFRMETKRAADKYNALGWVRNRSDGTVEALFEGDKTQVDSTIEWCRRGPSLAQVVSVNVKWGDYTGEFDRFEIRF